MPCQDKSMNLTRKQTSAKHVRETTMTKSILFGAVAALALGSTTALAADLPVKAAPPVVIYDWTGFYLGISGGGSFGGSNHVDPNGANYTADGISVRGGLVGGTVGYNWEVSRFVVGFEGDLSWVGEYGSHNDNNGFGLPAGGAGGGLGTSLFANPNFQSFTKETWLATARGRVGYAVNNLLFYATGGYAGAGVTAGINSTVNNASIFSSTSTRSGWTAGGGLEWGFAPNWSAKFEWLYMKFDNAGFTTALGDGPRSAVTLDDNVIRAGINYRFGGPVVAKY
jgi:outer membrane immunogenic protein